jgi:hypothetical protein
VARDREPTDARTWAKREAIKQRTFLGLAEDLVAERGLTPEEARALVDEIDVELKIARPGPALAKALAGVALFALMPILFVTVLLPRFVYALLFAGAVMCLASGLGGLNEARRWRGRTFF